MDAMRGCTQELRVAGCDAVEHGKSIKTFATPLFSVEVSQVKSNTHNSLGSRPRCWGEGGTQVTQKCSQPILGGKTCDKVRSSYAGKFCVGKKVRSVQIESARATLLAFWDRPNIVLGFVGIVGSPPCQVVFRRTFTDTETHTLVVGICLPSLKGGGWFRVYFRDEKQQKMENRKSDSDDL